MRLPAHYDTRGVYIFSQFSQIIGIGNFFAYHTHFHTNFIQNVFICLIPPPVTEVSVGPYRRRKKTAVDIIHHHYEKALKGINDGGIIAVMLKANGVPKSTFYKWKALAELKILDPLQFRALEEMYSEDSNELLRHVKETLQKDLYVEQAKELRKKKELLKR